MRRMGFYAGLDLGQQQDYTALTVIEKRRIIPPDVASTLPHDLDRSISRDKYYDRYGVNRYVVRHIQRWPLGTAYPDIVADVREMLERPEVQGDTWPTLALDRTGVGAGISDMFMYARMRRTAILPVTIHGGAKETHSGGSYNCPKRELVFGAVARLQKRELLISPKLAHASTLVEELRAFRLKVNINSGHDSYEAWREKDHDDLVLALCISLWAAQRGSQKAMVIEKFVK